MKATPLSGFSRFPGWSSPDVASPNALEHKSKTHRISSASVSPRFWFPARWTVLGFIGLGSPPQMAVLPFGFPLDQPETRAPSEKDEKQRQTDVGCGSNAEEVGQTAGLSLSIYHLPVVFWYILTYSHVSIYQGAIYFWYILTQLMPLHVVWCVFFGCIWTPTTGMWPWVKTNGIPFWGR